VKVRFDVLDVDETSAPEIYNLQTWISKGQEAEVHLGMNSKVGVDFYDAAQKILKNKSSLKVLAIHDANTKGLGGPLKTNKNFKDGGWISLVKSAGITNKQGDDALGSFGQGAKAPFAMSGLRTVFYYTKTNAETPQQSRFQGKSILQSMWLTDETFTGKAGFYGVLEADGHCKALLDSEIPNWVASSRRGQFDQNGTSLFVPAPGGIEDTNKFWFSIKVAVLANFYFAISESNLVVEFGDGTILKSDELESVYTALVLDKPDEIKKFSEKVQDALESSTTVQFGKASGETHGQFESQTFGQVSWFLRLGETVTGRNVGVARQNGMLITREAEKLKKFPAVRPFDLFVCVVGAEGSQILRSFENPEHNTFDFGRVVDEKERAKSQKAYEKFALDVRKLLADKVAAQISQEIKTNDLNHLFGGSPDESDGDKPDEKSTRLILAKPKKRPIISGEKTRVKSTELQPAGGITGGDGEVAGEGGNVPGNGDEGEAPAPAFTGRQVEELRVTPPDKNGQSKVHFTPTFKGTGILRLFKSGTVDREPIFVLLPNSAEYTSEIPFSSTDKARKTIGLTFKPEDLDFTIEAVISDGN
jgi:hypothetical protein